MPGSWTEVCSFVEDTLVMEMMGVARAEAGDYSVAMFVVRADDYDAATASDDVGEALSAFEGDAHAITMSGWQDVGDVVTQLLARLGDASDGYALFICVARQSATGASISSAWARCVWFAPPADTGALRARCGVEFAGGAGAASGGAASSSSSAAAASTSEWSDPRNSLCCLCDSLPLRSRYTFADCAGHAGFPVALADFGAPPSSFAKFDGTFAAAMHDKLVADPSWTRWADQRIVGERAGLVPPPLPVELMAAEFLDFLQQIEEPVDLTNPKYAAAAAAADDINDVPHLAVYRSLRGKTTENDYSNSFRTAFQRVLRAAGAVINVDSGKHVGSGETGVAAATSSGTRLSDTNTDGAVSVDLGKYGKCIVLNLVAKLHGIPSTQNDVYVWRHLPLKRGSSVLEIPTVLTERVANLPMILLDVYAGCVLQVRVAAWAGLVLCSTIVATASLRSAPGSASRLQLVGVLHATGVAVDQLYTRYKAAAAAEATAKMAADSTRMADSVAAASKGGKKH